MDKISFFSADYRDGRVHFGGKSYPAGTFAAHLLTQYYINDTCGRSESTGNRRTDRLHQRYP